MRVNKNRQGLAPKWAVRYSKNRGGIEDSGDKGAYVYAWTHYGARLQGARRHDWLLTHPYMHVERVHTMPVAWLLRTFGALVAGTVSTASALLLVLAGVGELQDTPKVVGQFNEQPGTLSENVPMTVPIFVVTSAGDWECQEFCPPAEGDPGWDCHTQGNKLCGYEQVGIE